MAGKASSPISVNQSPQYGDKLAIERLKQSTTVTPMTGTPTPKPTAGRPQVNPTQPVEGGLPVPTAHAEAADDLARKAWSAQHWSQMAMDPTAGVFVRMYAQMAVRRYREAFIKTRGRTPFFS